MIVPGHPSDIIELMRIELAAFPQDGYEITALQSLITHSLVFLKMVNPHDMQIIGFAICSNLAGEENAESTPAAELITLAIHPKHQGQGYGQRLLTRTLIELRHFHVQVVQSHVKTTNEAAVHIYQKNNFRILETRAHYYDESKLSAYRMALKL